MDTNVFALWVTTYDLIAKGIAKYKLTTNTNGQYSHAAILVFK